MIIADAHQYLLDHYNEFDFIWSSPPCPSHSIIRFGQAISEKSAVLPIYPDLSLYQEVIFLDDYFKGKYVVENVIPYYEPLISAQKRGRHLYWCNFKLPKKISNRVDNTGLMHSKNEIASWCEFHDYDFKRYKGLQRRDKISRNLVDYEAGKTILETAMGIQRQNNCKQMSLAL